NDQDEPPVPTSLILRMTARLWRYRLSAATRMSAEREPVLMRGAGCGTTTRCCGQSTWRLCVERVVSQNSDAFARAREPGYARNLRIAAPFLSERNSPPASNLQRDPEGSRPLNSF